MPFALEAAVASLPVYCANEGQSGIIDTLIEFLVDGGYQWSVRACPTTLQQGGSNTILANQTFEDQISVPAGSFLTMIGGISTQPTFGFRFRMYDAGAQAYISDGFVREGCSSGRYLPTANTGTGQLITLTGNKNLFILPSPLSISSPGQLQVQITNLANVTATIEMAFIFATPIGGMSISGAVIGNSVSK